MQKNVMIYKQAAIDVVEKHACNTQRILDAIYALPSAQPESNWIPVSEKIPEDYKEVLVWLEYSYFESGTCRNNKSTMCAIGEHSTVHDIWIIDHVTGWRNMRVIAWMPLPEPYKTERKTDEHTD